MKLFVGSSSSGEDESFAALLLSHATRRGGTRLLCPLLLLLPTLGEEESVSVPSCFLAHDRAPRLEVVGLASHIHMFVLLLLYSVLCCYQGDMCPSLTHNDLAQGRSSERNTKESGWDPDTFSGIQDLKPS